MSLVSGILPQRIQSRLSALVFIGLVFSGCNRAQFGGQQYRAVDPNSTSTQNGSGTPAVQYDQNGQPLPFGTPISPAVEQPGWVGNEIKNSVDGLFKTGEVPASTAPSAPGGPGTPGNGSIPGGSGAPNTARTDGRFGNGGIPGLGSIPGLGGIPRIGGTNTPGRTDASAGGGNILTDSAGVLWLPCRADGEDAGQFPADFYAKLGSRVRVAGEFCPKAKVSSDVTVLFLIDRSGSMEGVITEGPNDKTTNGSCGRLRASELLVKKYQTMVGTNVRAGVIRFGTQASVRLPVAGIDTVAANLNADVFCGSEAGAAGLTNYYAAFSSAAEQIASIPGDKVVYLISDGSPTVGLGDPRQSGLAAAQRLRSIPGVNLFALFVGYNAGSAVNPRGYLEQVAGDAKLVRVTANAEELVKAAATLGTIPVIMKAADASATLENPSGISPLRIERFEPRQDVANRYYWITEPFILVGSSNPVTLNKVTVTAKTSTGETLQSVSNIGYHELKAK